MKSLMALRNHIAITFCLFAISSTGCIAYQTVNSDLLEQNRGKTFKLGIVKAAGNQSDFRSLASDIFGLRPSSIYFEIIKTAVENIPTAEICSLLSSQYSITIDANVDKTVRVGEERIVRQTYVSRGRPQDNKYEWRDITIKSLNAQYGNPNTKEFPDVINVTYSYDMSAFYYDIDIISSGQKIVTLHGKIGEKFNADLDSYIYYARRISQALKRDLNKASKVDPSN